MLPIFDPCGAAVLEHDARRVRPGAHGKIGACKIGREIRARSAPALAVPLRQLIEADAFLLGAVEVGIALHPLRFRRRKPQLREAAGRARIGDVERTALAMKVVGKPLVVLRPRKYGSTSAYDQPALPSAAHWS